MKSDPLLDEIYAIRREIYEEIKDMTVEERVAYINQCGEEIAKEYGFKVIQSANKKHEAKLMSADADVIENAKT